MAEKKTSFPLLPVNHWWTLREKFKQSIPGTVTANYLATVLDMKEVSARGNVLPYLLQLGIIDEDGKTLARAREWRDDTIYPDLCLTIAKEIYPPELLDAVTDPVNDRAAAERWFSNKTGAGVAAVQKMTRFFPFSLTRIRKTSRDPDQHAQRSPNLTAIRRNRRPGPHLKQSRNRVTGKTAKMICPMCTLTCRYTFRQTPHRIKSTKYSRAWRHIYIERVDIGDGTEGTSSPTSCEASAGRSTFQLRTTFRGRPA